MSGELGLAPPDVPVAGDLRRRAARGVLVNAAFLIGLNALGFLKGFAVAAFLSVSEYGTWGLVIVAFTTLLAIVQVGVDDKYIQQREPDQQAAFEKAFTLQCLLSGVFAVVIAAALPLYALAYGEDSILAPGYALMLVLPALALQAPQWTYYRRMEYFQQRRLQAFDPVVGLVVTIALAAAGAGYWALVAGVVAGAWAAALAAIRASPYRLRLRYERGTARTYWRFSGPLFLSALAGIAIVQVPLIVAQHAVGLGGVGVIAIASTISSYANRVDEVVTNTLYPAICAVRDRTELLLESFLKSNRLALLWAMPAGVGIVLFAPDLVTRVLGERWSDATYPIQAFGLAAAINQVGFNWSAFFRAIGQTRPLAWGSGVMVAGVAAVAIPLLIVDGVDGYATGMGVAVLGLIAARLVFLRRLFPLRAIVRNTLRGVLPTLPPLALVLALRATEPSIRGASDALAELAVFVVAAILSTALFERALLRELRSYLRREAGRPIPAA